jgi:hypothetical protein
MNLVFGLIGGISSGKTTAAEYLSENHRFVEIYTATILKTMVVDMYDLPAECAFGTQEQKSEPRPELGMLSTRMVLEHFAKEFRRYNTDVFLDRAVRHITAPRIVISNIRYHNEHHWVKSRRGFIIRMNVLREKPPSTGHETDTLWREMPYDYSVNVIRGDIEGMQDRLDEIVRLAIEANRAS